MEQITKRNGKYYYGEQVCSDSNDAYCRFRDDYHASLGKRVYRRLNSPERKERLHGFHVYYSPDYERRIDEEFCGGMGEGIQRVRYRLLGIVNLSYCRMLYEEDFPDYEEEQFWRWIDWLLLHEDKLMYQVGLKDKSGRTSKNKKRYR